MKHLEGKIAIITGSSRGIGRAIAEQLANLGAGVVVNYASSPDRAKEVVAGIIQKGGKATECKRYLLCLSASDEIHGELRKNRESVHVRDRTNVSGL